MEGLDSPQASASADEEPGSLRDAAGWWEPRRLLYNAVLSAIFIALAARTWPRFGPELTRDAILPLFVLALLANLCYSAAYVAELAVPFPRAPRALPRWRWALWVTGTLFAVAIETYWFLDEILPPPR